MGFKKNKKDKKDKKKIVRKYSGVDIKSVLESTKPLKIENNNSWVKLYYA